MRTGAGGDRAPVNWPAVALIGLGVGFLSGLFGKGGSAVATPLLHAVGVPALVAVAAPLPATIPSTLAATAAYWRERLVDRRVLAWSMGVGVPATAAGALATKWVGGDALITATDVVVAVLGVRFLVFPGDASDGGDRPPAMGARLVGVGLVVGFTSGLLANSGGFLLAPLYLAVLRMPVKPAFATSLAVATVLAVPGTIVHAALGHIDWSVVAVFAATSVPLSYLGARVALRTDATRLERAYGAALTVLGLALLAVRFTS
ncbi:MAG: sulfite exporter TauE/SafE family protein [Acidimicrobiales bacterium]